jgi:hypothetical protein
MFLFAAWQSLRMGAASWAAQDVEQQFTEWNKRINTTGMLPTLTEWQAAMDQVRTAQARSPQDAYLAEIEARLLSQVVRTADGFANRQADAVVPWERAAVRRPTSPYTWAGLAAALYSAGKTGARFDRALEMAVETGPYEREVLFTVVDLGLAVWETAPATTRAAIQTALRNADRREAPVIAAIASRRGKLEQACPLPNTAKTPQCVALKTAS